MPALRLVVARLVVRQTSTNRKPAREERTPWYDRNNPTMTRHDTTNGVMVLTQSAPDLVQRLPGLPSTPNVALINRRKPKPPWSDSNTTFAKQIYTKWCCIDLSNAPS